MWTASPGCWTTPYTHQGVDGVPWVTGHTGACAQTMLWTVSPGYWTIVVYVHTPRCEWCPLVTGHTGACTQTMLWTVSPGYWRHWWRQPRDCEVHRETTNAGPVSGRSQVFSRECGLFSCIAGSSVLLMEGGLPLCAVVWANPGINMKKRKAHSP